MQSTFRHLPLLAGPSRKRFLGHLTGAVAFLLNPAALVLQMTHSVWLKTPGLLPLQQQWMKVSRTSRHSPYPRVRAGEQEAAQRDTASAAAAALCATSGAHIVRMHNVAAGVQAVRVADAVKLNSAPPWS